VADSKKFVEKLMQDLKAIDPDYRESQRELAAKLAAREIDDMRLRMAEARKTNSTLTGSFLASLGLGRPDRQGGKATRLEIIEGGKESGQSVRDGVVGREDGPVPISSSKRHKRRRKRKKWQS